MQMGSPLKAAMAKGSSHSPSSASTKDFDKSQLLHANLSISMRRLENLLGEDASRGSSASRELRTDRNENVADSFAIVLDDSTLPKVDLHALASSTGLAKPNSSAKKKGHFLFEIGKTSTASSIANNQHAKEKPAEIQDGSKTSKAHLNHGNVDDRCDCATPKPRNQWKPSDAADWNRDPIEKVLERVTLDLEIDEDLLRAPSELDRELNSLVELQTETRAALLRTRSLQNVARQSSCKQLKRQSSLQRK
jgi:hypothetical protein